MSYELQLLTWKLRAVMADRGIRFSADLHRRLMEVLGSDAPSQVQVNRLVRVTPSRLSMRTLEGLCLVLNCSPDELLHSRPEQPVTPSLPTGLVDVDLPGSVRVPQGINELAATWHIPMWATEADFIADDPEHRRRAHFIDGRLRDAPNDPGQWILKHLPYTGEIYAYRTPPVGDRFAAACTYDPDAPHGRTDGTGDRWGPCYLLGRIYSTDLLIEGIERADIANQPGGIAWVHGRVDLLNRVLRSLVLKSPPALEDDLRHYVYSLGDGKDR